MTLGVTGPVSNALSVRFSCRSVVFAGGLLISCGFVSSAFVPSFNWLYLTYMTGLFVSVFVSVVICVCQCVRQYVLALCPLPSCPPSTGSTSSTAASQVCLFVNVLICDCQCVVGVFVSVFWLCILRARAHIQLALPYLQLDRPHRSVCLSVCSSVCSSVDCQCDRQCVLALCPPLS